MKDEVEGFGWVAVIKFEEVSERLTLLEGNDGKEGVASEGQIQSCFGSSMPLSVLLPGRSVAFVVIAIFNIPVLADCLDGAVFFLWAKTGEEEAGMD